MTLPKIISSGIPGAESAALDVAIRLEVPYGGYAINSMLDAYRATWRYKALLLFTKMVIRYNEVKKERAPRLPPS